MSTILIVDDHPLIAETLAMALAGPGVSVTTVNPAIEDPAELIATGNHEFCLLDLDWGSGTFRGLELIEPCVRAGTVCVILTGTSHDPLFGYCLELGAVGVIPKQEGFAYLTEAVRRAVEGQEPNSDGDRVRWMLAANKARTSYRQRHQPFESLTSAERDVLSDLMVGRVVPAIAKQRYVAESTVRSHVHQILRKLGVSSQVAAIGLANEAGWTADSEPRGGSRAGDLAAILPPSRPM